MNVIMNHKLLLLFIFIWNVNAFGQTASLSDIDKRLSIELSSSFLRYNAQLYDIIHERNNYCVSHHKACLAQIKWLDLALSAKAERLVLPIDLLWHQSIQLISKETEARNLLKKILKVSHTSTPMRLLPITKLLLLSYIKKWPLLKNDVLLEIISLQKKNHQGNLDLTLFNLTQTVFYLEDNFKPIPTQPPYELIKLGWGWILPIKDWKIQGSDRTFWVTRSLHSLRRIGALNYIWEISTLLRPQLLSKIPEMDEHGRDLILALCPAYNYANHTEYCLDHYFIPDAKPSPSEMQLKEAQKYFYQKNYRQALLALQKIKSENEHDKLFTNILNLLGTCQYHLNDFAAAEKTLQESKEISQARGDRTFTHNYFLYLVRALRAQAKFSEALALLQTSEEIQKKSTESPNFDLLQTYYQQLLISVETKNNRTSGEILKKLNEQFTDDLFSSYYKKGAAALAAGGSIAEKNKNLTSLKKLPQHNLVDFFDTLKILEKNIQL